jgi:hypothetical protein
MRHVCLSALALVFALPLAAQSGGMANRRSPTVGQSITFNNGCAVEISYKALTWAQGRFMETLKTPEGRERTNKDMKSNPTGSLKVSQDVTLGGQSLKSGDYKLYFAVDDDQKFWLVLADAAGSETKWKLDLNDKADMNTRLSLTLSAGKSDSEANLGIAFGTMATTVTLNANGGGNRAKDAAGAKGESKGNGKE